MKQTWWKVFLLVALVAIIAGCAPTAPAAPGQAAGEGAAPAATVPPVIELDTDAAPMGADWMMTASEENPKRGGTLITAWGMAPTHFDMHQGGGCAGCAMMYNGLIMWNVADGYHTIVPALATEWSLSDDQLVYTFKLREGVTFQDGSEFNADDVVATFNRIISPPDNLSISGIREQLSMVASVTAPDPMTVEFTLSQPTPFFLEVLAGDSMVVYSAEELEANDFDLRGVTVPTGTGPFKFVEYLQGEKLVLEANTDYWNAELPYVDGVEMLHVPAWPDRGTAVLTGQADLTFNGSVDTWLEAQSRPEMVTAQAPCLNSHMIAINNEHPPFDNPLVRRAIHLAIDRQAIIDAFTPVWEPAFVSRWLPAASPWATPQEEVLQMPGYRPDKTEDIETARQLLADAGFPDGFETTFTAWTEASSSEVAVPAFAELMRTALNITGEIQVVERPRTNDVLSAGDFDLFKADIYASPILDPYPLWNLYLRTGASQNWSKYSNPDFDALLDELALENEPGARQEIINRGLDMLDENPPFFLIGFCAHSVIANQAVKGLSIENRAWSKFDRFETVWLDR
ncbi:MAG: ABC transporter substrate-binding protein [Caldilineaceae bacterium]|nr:ABC transporter substrate-binding protein [Caldilineaceae bacterium]